MKSPSLGKFQKLEKDKYYSFDPKIGHALHMDLIDEEFTYIEPCCGAGDLISQIKGGKCVQAIDIEPEISKDSEIYSVTEKGDARYHPLVKADYIISNPAFSREYKQSFFTMLQRFLREDVKAIYMLLPFNWICNQDFQWAMEYCESIRPIGRLKWIPGSTQTETKDHLWYKFITKKTDTIAKPLLSRRKFSNRDLIIKMKKIHNNDYDYILKNLDRLDKNNRLTVICKIHGEYEANARSHLEGNSKCYDCRSDLFFEDWLKVSSEKHGNKYDYSKVNYINKRKEVTIICPVHGEFNQIAGEHKRGHGCHSCSGSENVKLATPQIIKFEDFVSRAINKFGHKFEYLEDSYEKFSSEMEFICDIHGIIKQLPHSHLIGTGCPKCANSFGVKENIWLDSLDIKDLVKQYIVYIPDEICNLRKYYKVDAYDPETKTIYEFLGDYWHSNISMSHIYPDELHSIKKFKNGMRMTNSQVFLEDVKRFNVLKKLGYNIKFVRENDFNSGKMFTEEL